VKLKLFSVRMPVCTKFLTNEPSEQWTFGATGLRNIALSPTSRPVISKVCISIFSFLRVHWSIGDYLREYMVFSVYKLLICRKSINAIEKIKKLLCRNISGCWQCLFYSNTVLSCAEIFGRDWKINFSGKIN